jgi:hypothetical protein
MNEKPNARELLKEARAELAKAHDHLMELTAKLPMQYFGLVDGNIIQAEDCLIDQIDAYLAAPSNACPKCDGKGWTAEHSADANAHDEEGNCNPGYCPVQVQCAACGGTGLAAPSESAMEMVDKIRKIFEDAACYANDDHAEYSELLEIARANAAALIEGLQRRVPRAMLEELLDMCFDLGDEYFLKGGKEYAEQAVARILAKHGVEVD